MPEARQHDVLHCSVRVDRQQDRKRPGLRSGTQASQQFKDEFSLRYTVGVNATTHIARTRFRLHRRATPSSPIDDHVIQGLGLLVHEGCDHQPWPCLRWGNVEVRA